MLPDKTIAGNQDGSPGVRRVIHARRDRRWGRGGECERRMSGTGGTGSSNGAPGGAVPGLNGVFAWLAERDPGYAALRRASRAALIMPAMFALADKAIGNPIVATFAAFGSFAMLMLVDFSGSIKDRVLDQAVLGVACALMICIGTLASRTTWLAALAMALVAFVVLFAGAVSSVLAGATTPLLLSFILPVSLPGPVSSIPDRVAGWGLAAGASLLAISLLWPSPVRNPVRLAATAACRALADRLRARVSYVTSAGGPDAEQAHRAAVTRADEAVQAMQAVFFATPYRPTGLATDARAVVRLVDELRWLDTIVLRSAPRRRPTRSNPHVCAVELAAAGVLDRAAELLEAPDGPREGLSAAMAQMRSALAELERATVTLLPARSTSLELGDGRTPQAQPSEPRPENVVSSLDPSFRAQELSFVVAQIATNTDFAAAAARRSWVDRLLGRQPQGLQGTLAAAQERAGAHVTRDSLWLQNSLRGAVALGLAVLVADLSGVQHGFWVAFGTLSVLRSSALATGENILRALAGTTTGFLAGGVLVYLIGTNTTLLWVLLPVVILGAGLAPSAISFAAGQAAFTLTLLILFNIIAPAGWRIGLVRVEDVAIGGAVSLGVGLLFWPRGAAAALGRSLAQAYTDSARYLSAAIAYGVGCCDPIGPQPDPRPGGCRRCRRLPAAGRGVSGLPFRARPKSAPLAGSPRWYRRHRRAARRDAVLDLWDGNGVRAGDRSSARLQLMNAAANMTGWYEHLAASLTAREAVPDPLLRPVGDGRLLAGGRRTSVTLTGSHRDWGARDLDRRSSRRGAPAAGGAGSAGAGRRVRRRRAIAGRLTRCSRG